MNIRTFNRNYLLSIFVFLLGGNTSSGFNLDVKETTYDNEIERRVMSMPSQIELRYNEQVYEFIDLYINRSKNLSRTILGRATMYFPMIESVLSAYQVPDELKYLPVIEAGLLPYLTSSAGASGLWQFMPTTAELYGLKITSTIDERRDAQKSTEAAAAYLKRLYQIYGDWTLVLAAYNCGDGVLNRAMQKTSSKSYWDIQKFLPKQTQEFVPKFIAVQYMMNYFYMHELDPIAMPDDYVYTGQVKVYQKMDFDAIAAKYNLDAEILKRLNAIYTKGFIPASDGDYVIHLPETILYDFINNENLYTETVVLSIASYNRQQQAIAQAEQVKVQRENIPIENIPANNSNPLAIVQQREALKIEDEGIIKVVKLKRGKSLYDIAKENNTNIASLLELNKIDEANPPRVGDAVKVRVL